MMAVRTGRLRHYLFAGLAWGALVLTKAVFLYIAVPIIVCFAGWIIWRWWRDVLDIRAVCGLLVFLFGLGLIVGPWIARNYYYLGAAQVTHRGGLPMMIRAIHNQMNWTEYFGTFYVWAPAVIRDELGHILGFSEDDLEKGGRLQHLNESSDSEFAHADQAAESAGLPQNAVSYYSRARAELFKIRHELEEAGVAQPRVAAGAALKRRAVSMILGDPFSHAAMTLPALWRGAVLIAPCLVLLLAFAFSLRRIDLIAFLLPSLGLIMFLALTTHNLPRYNSPSEPVAVIGLIFAANHLLLWFRRKHLRLPQQTRAGVANV
jgi:4-amino-4-deoxy-L-arabinose transferase-like glycosyltransferase